MIRTTLSAAVLAAAALTLAACGDDGMSGMDHSASSSPDQGATGGATGINNADITFAQGMIPHHRQAVEMSELAATRAADAEVKELAQQIRGAQDPEIATMTGWLEKWGEPLPSEMGGHSMSGHVDGMMTADEMADLENAQGAEFDRLFLTLMIKHHKGAIAMAQTEQKDGADPATRELAGEIIKAQKAEIQLMEEMLG
jgi:uncharacterized protein (DUF305 family)